MSLFAQSTNIGTYWSRCGIVRRARLSCVIADFIRVTRMVPYPEEGAAGGQNAYIWANERALLNRGG